MEWLKKVSVNCNILRNMETCWFHALSTGRFSLSHFWGSALYTCVFYLVSLSQGCNLRMTRVSVSWNERGLRKPRTPPCSKRKKVCHEEPCNFGQSVSLINFVLLPTRGLLQNLMRFLYVKLLRCLIALWNNS